MYCITYDTAASFSLFPQLTACTSVCLYIAESVSESACRYAGSYNVSAAAADGGFISSTPPFSSSSSS